MRRLNYALIFCLLSLSIFCTSVDAADKIRIGTPAGAGYITLPLAQKKGFLKEEGFEAEIIQIVGYPAMAALATGEIGYHMGFSAPLQAAFKGLPIRVIASFMPFAPFALVAQPEIKSAQELKGKTVGVNAIGTGLDIATRMMLKHFGLDPEREVKIIRAGGTTDGRIAAMQQGLIAATAVGIPGDLQAKKMGFNVLAKAHELFSYPESGLWVTVKKMKEKPDEIKRLIRAGLKANRYIRSNRDETIQFMIQWARVDREMATGSYESLFKVFSDDGSIPEKGLRVVIEENKKIANVERDVALSEVADFSILGDVQRELGILAR